jgi:hypothetical protein
MTKRLACKLEAITGFDIEIIDTLKYKVKMSNECPLRVELVALFVIISKFFVVVYVLLQALRAPMYPRIVE